MAKDTLTLMITNLPEGSIKGSVESMNKYTQLNGMITAPSNNVHIDAEKIIAEYPECYNMMIDLLSRVTSFHIVYEHAKKVKVKNKN